MGLLDGVNEVATGDKYDSLDQFAIPIMEARYDSIVKDLYAHFTDIDWRAKKVVDFGSGSGGYGRRFADMGSQVTFVDGRIENLQQVQDLLPKASTVLIDLERYEPSKIEYSDLSLFMGTLYHLGKPLEVLEAISKSADNICLETACLDHDGVAVVYFNEETGPSGKALNGVACRPSPKWIDEALRHCGFTLVKNISCSIKTVDPIPEGLGGLVFDWKFQRTCGWRRNECSLRSMFIASKSRTTTIFKDFVSY